MKQLPDYLLYLEKWLKSVVKNANQKGIICGISGGIDSAVVIAMIAKVFPNNHLALIMPCESDDLDAQLANQLSQRLSLNSKTIDLTNTYNAFLATNSELSTLAKGNLKARLRMAALYAYAQTNNYLVAGTDNACEWYIGYFTKFGDGAADIAPIIYLNKSEVYQAAKIYNINQEIIDRVPTAGLWEGQSDEKELGFSYNVLDKFLSGDRNIDANIIKKIEKYHQNSKHKREGILKPDNFN